MDDRTASLNLYCSLMDEIKRRDFVIRAFLSGKSSTPYPMTNIESIYLQIRKTLELIALGSLVAHKKEYSRHNEMFIKHTDARKILRSIEKINPDFYPKPTKEVPSDTPGIINEFVDRPKEEYLTKTEFIKLYEKCGGLMHAENPYGSKKDIKYYEENIKVWMGKIVKLLNSHRIHLLNENWFYLIHMKENGTDKVRGYVFGETSH